MSRTNRVIKHIHCKHIVYRIYIHNQYHLNLKRNIGKMKFLHFSKRRNEYHFNHFHTYFFGFISKTVQNQLMSDKDHDPDDKIVTVHEYRSKRSLVIWNSQLNMGLLSKVKYVSIPWLLKLSIWYSINWCFEFFVFKWSFLFYSL